MIAMLSNSSLFSFTHPVPKFEHIVSPFTPCCLKCLVSDALNCMCDFIDDPKHTGPGAPVSIVSLHPMSFITKKNYSLVFTAEFFFSIQPKNNNFVLYCSHRIMHTHICMSSVRLFTRCFFEHRRMNNP